MTGSFLDELEQIGAQLRSRAVKELDVPGSAGKLVVRFRPPTDEDALTPVVAAYKVQGALPSDLAKQLIVDCCDEILRRTPAGTLEPRDPAGGPLRFDAGDDRWGKKVKTARDCVSELYHLKQQPLAHIGHADLLVDWLQGLDAEIAARAAGESDGGAAS
jgi:hypothetical protein